jgi:uncharacterized protein
MKLNIFKDLKVEQLSVFASLPDMGKVGGIVSSYLSQNLRAEYIAEIVSTEKPWVSNCNGIVKSVVETYQIYYSKLNKLLIFTGVSQPQEPSELYKLCSLLLDYVQTIGKVGRLYSAGGYLREQVTGAPRVCGVVSRIELKRILAKSNIDFIGNEINCITWFNGLILGLAGDRNIDSIGLFGEISETTIAQPLAAKSIVKAFTKIENIKLDTKALDKQYEAILEDVQNQKEQFGFRSDVG